EQMLADGATQRVDGVADQAARLLVGDVVDEERRQHLAALGPPAHGEEGQEGQGAPAPEYDRLPVQTDVRDPKQLKAQLGHGVTPYRNLTAPTPPGPWRRRRCAGGFLERLGRPPGRTLVPGDHPRR